MMSAMKNMVVNELNAMLNFFLMVVLPALLDTQLFVLTT
jgi:hypothetical protein